MSSRAEVRIVCAAAIAVACVLAGAGDAAAVVRCVPDESPGGCQVAPYATINAAEAAAIDGDTIKLKGQVFTEGVTTNKRLSFVGAGAGPLSNCASTPAGASVIAAPANQTALKLTRGGSVTGIRLHGGAGNDDPGSNGGVGLHLTAELLDPGPFNYTVRDVCSAGGPDPGLSPNPGPGFSGGANPPTVTALTVSDSSFESPGGGGAVIGGTDDERDAHTCDGEVQGRGREPVHSDGLAAGASQLTATESSFEGVVGVSAPLDLSLSVAAAYSGAVLASTSDRERHDRGQPRTRLGGCVARRLRRVQRTGVRSGGPRRGSALRVIDGGAKFDHLGHVGHRPEPRLRGPRGGNRHNPPIGRVAPGDRHGSQFDRAVRRERGRSGSGVRHRHERRHHHSKLVELQHGGPLPATPHRPARRPRRHPPCTGQRLQRHREGRVRERGCARPPARRELALDRPGRPRVRHRRRARPRRSRAMRSRVRVAAWRGRTSGPSSGRPSAGRRRRRPAT